MAESDPGNVEDLSEAARAAERVISRLQELAARHLAEHQLDEAEAFYAIVEELETAPEITALRRALHDDPQRFGEKSPTAPLPHAG